MGLVITHYMNIYKTIYNKFFNSPKIKFYCELPEVKENYPVIEASKYKFNWVKESAKKFKEISKEKSSYEQISGTVRCPGVLPMMRKGYIMQSWFDLTIRLTDDANRFEFFIPQGLYSYLRDKGYDKQLISWFSKEEPAHAIPLPNSQLQSLIKITLPWAVSVPKGWNLIFMPIPYPDQTDFVSVHGILGPGKHYDVNAIIKCNSNNKEFSIPAGTPLFQIIAVRDNNDSIEILDYDADIKQKETERKYLSNHQFIVKD